MKTKKKKREPNEKIERAGAILALACFLLVLGFFGWSGRYLAIAALSFVIGVTVYCSRQNKGYSIAMITGALIILLCHIGK